MEKQRKFLMVLPLLVLPFLTMAFWALGGGKGGSHAVLAKGLDIELPQAQFKDKDRKTDKLSVYELVAKDSARDGISPAFLHAVGLEKSKVSQPDSLADADAQARQVQSKLQQLNKQLQEPPSTSVQTDAEESEPANVKQFHHMMKRLNSQASRPDPEMQQLNRMLDKIQAIQNPEQTAKPLKAEVKAKPFRAIPAMVDGKQKVLNGGTVRLKLSDSVSLKGIKLPKGQLVFGACQVTNQRLLLTIQNVRIGKNILPVDLTIFSLDGMPGIPAPEAELSGAVSDGATNAINSMQFLSMDQSLTTQAAAGGINAAKELFSKKVRKIKVKLKNEFPVLLKNNH